MTSEKPPIRYMSQPALPGIPQPAPHVVGRGADPAVVHMRPQQYVGGIHVYFRVNPDGTLRNIHIPEAKKATELAHLRVTLHIFRTESGHLSCGRAEVSTVPIHRDEEEFEDREPIPVGASVWRQLRVGEFVDVAIAEARRLAGWLHNLDPSFYEPVASAGRDLGRRGPKVTLTAELLRGVVAPAYLGGGRKPLQSVRDALALAGYNSGFVTIDQARAAVRKARRPEFGFIPPAKRSEE